MPIFCAQGAHNYCGHGGFVGEVRGAIVRAREGAARPSEREKTSESPAARDRGALTGVMHPHVDINVRCEGASHISGLRRRYTILHTEGSQGGVRELRTKKKKKLSPSPLALG